MKLILKSKSCVYIVGKKTVLEKRDYILNYIVNKEK